MTAALELVHPATVERPRPEVFGGVDTHKDTHTAAAVDGAGRMLGHRQFPATAAGYAALWGWLAGLGAVVKVGVEGTSSWGAGLAEFLRSVAVPVLEVNRPNRATRRRVGKSDPVDAEAAARAALAGHATAIPKTADGAVASIRVLRIARTSAIRQRTDVLRQIKSIIDTAPETLRALLRDLPTPALITTCTRWRPAATGVADPTTATKLTLRSLARRHTQLLEEISDLDRLLGPLVQATAPALTACFGVGTEVAGQLLVTVGDNPDRVHSEAALAMLCGAAPIPASSGKTRRHRLNRGGDRQANAALYRVVIVRMRYHQATRDYVERRTAEGLSKNEIIRCLKRYLVREIYSALASATPSEDLEEAA